MADFSAAVTAGEPCGVLDPATSRCAERYHQHGCSAMATSEIAEILHEAGVYQDLAATPWLDRHGRPWRNQHGALMILAGHIHAASGTRPAAGPFVTRERPEVSAAQRQARYGDVDDEADPGDDIARRYSSLGRKMGLTQPTAARERERCGELRDRALADIALRSQGRVHPDFGESARERVARLHRPAVLMQADDGRLGGLASYRPG